MTWTRLSAPTVFVNLFDVRIHAIRRRRNRRHPFEVRWHAADRSRSKSFITRRLADSYRAELVRAARKGLEFDPVTASPSCRLRRSLLPPRGTATRSPTQT